MGADQQLSNQKFRCKHSLWLQFDSQFDLILIVTVFQAESFVGEEILVPTFFFD